MLVLASPKGSRKKARALDFDFAGVVRPFLVTLFVLPKEEATIWQRDKLIAHRPGPPKKACVTSVELLNAFCDKPASRGSISRKT